MMGLGSLCTLQNMSFGQVLFDQNHVDMPLLQMHDFVWTVVRNALENVSQIIGGILIRVHTHCYFDKKCEITLAHDMSFPAKKL